MADKYISSHGLRFNPIKTHCITFGKTSFVKDPEWSLDGTLLTQSTNIMYLGANLSNNNHDHVESRIKSCRKAFFALQSIGFFKGGLAPDTMAHIWKTAIQPILLYATQCFTLKKKSLDELDRIQARLLKSSLGLSKFCRNTPLLQALKIQKPSTLIDAYNLDLIRSHFSTFSKGRIFYTFMLKQHMSGRLNGHDNLLNRVRAVSDKHGVSVMKYIFDNEYVRKYKTKIKAFTTDDGVIDSAAYLLYNFNNDNRQMLQMLLLPF